MCYHLPGMATIQSFLISKIKISYGLTQYIIFFLVFFYAYISR